MKTYHSGLAGTFVALFALSAHAEPIKVTSPNGRVVITVDRGEHEHGREGLTYSVSFDGRAIIAASTLGLNLDKGAIGTKDYSLTRQTQISVDTTYQMVVGKAKTVPDHYNQSELSFKDAKNIDFKVIVRAYDEGVALRYVIPEQPTLKDYVVTRENTQYNFAADFDCWGSNMSRFDTSFEGEYDPIKASKLRRMHMYTAPMVCQTGVGQTTFAIAESDVKDYPGAFLSGRFDGGLGLMTTLTPRYDNDRNARDQNTVLVKPVIGPDGFKSPWRVVMIGDTPGDLTESNLIPTLAAPSVIKDTSWIKAGKTAWDWYNGWTVDIPNAGVNTATYKAYIDFAHAMGLEYLMIDEGWSVGSSIEASAEADITKPIKALDLPEVIAYAKSKGVGVWVWVQWQQLDAQMDEALAAYEKWGIKGIKVDFMNRNDQEMVDYYHKLLGKAADHRIMVDMHGAYPPNGLVRTFPNYMTQEAVLGAEYNKWSTRVTATHNVTLPFTRMILGPIDYTPGGFRHLSPEAFDLQHRRIAPFVKTTRGQGIAMYVVYDSPLQMVSDSPSAYKNPDGTWADGVDFIRKVPATWDETRVVAGEIGKYIITARRSGSDWYIGAMTNEEGRTVTVPLNFLPKGKHTARLWQDGADISRLSVSDQAVEASASLTLTLAPSGGAAVLIKGTQTKPKKRK